MADSVLGTTSEWLYVHPGQVPLHVKLAADQRVIEARSDMSEHLFNQGTAFFYELLLVPDGEVSQPASEWMSGPLVAGPITEDCS
ncbi:hypothetical protein [Myxococcus xanthus]|uniref:hypothetical protein n=1 Tax=Myxococcus xanthus TaxID=34 RepID=UPI001F3B65C1|nr:hypothetical protein [Myxococcus xanthus]